MRWDMEWSKNVLVVDICVVILNVRQVNWLAMETLPIPVPVKIDVETLVCGHAVIARSWALVSAVLFGFW
ncbi:hypothetical protein [Caulobacter endophyticus]|uniref:hypothetical protein n=1 Tax=Caulobacter endophyticus TaxID=2172652 RepID=UPI00240ED8B3|nr:hypothetical protein [Caulobacter endophyticus]MDG2527714.1 hypothetical protein [Caulobacter endophyticus]